MNVPKKLLTQKKTLNLHLTYFVETLYSASPQTNKKALIPLRIRETTIPETP